VNKIKVLFFYPNEFYGPVLTVFTHIIRHLDRERFVPYVVINGEASGTLSLSEAEGVIIRRFKFGRGLRGSPRAMSRSAVLLPAGMSSLIQWARREGIDVVQCASTAQAAALGLALAKATGARLLIHYHNLLGRQPGQPPYGGPRRFLERLAARRADRLVTVSRFVADQVIATGIPRDKIDVVINGANLDRFRPDIDGSSLRQEYGVAPDAPLVLQLARIVYHKRQEDVVRAFAIACKQAPELRCLIIGWETPGRSGAFPTYRAELQHICEQEGLGDRLTIAPARPEAPQLMAAADIVAMPSIDDPCPLVVTEAMAAGKPVIGAASGGIPELISDGETGFLVPPRSPEALAEKLVALAQDPALRAQMGQAARRRAETYFDEARLAAQFAPIYEALARSKAGPKG
jgi:glycosyltransferase involved in cell wall biosynthesis